MALGSRLGWTVDAAGDPAAGPVESEQAAIRAEADSYDGLLLAETQHDPFVGLALAARATERVELASAIAVAFARSPMTMATVANDLHLVSAGRFRLGLGSQVRAHIERRFSMPWSRPAARMREYVAAVRAIWASWATSEPLRFEGEFYRHTLMTPFFSPGPNPHGNPPILVAGVGERMTETAGRAADGFVCHTFTTATYLREVTLPALERGLAARGHEAPRFSVSLPALVIVGETERDRAEAETAARQQLAFYGSTPAYKPVLETHGWGELHDRLHAKSRAGEWDAMARLVSDDVLAQFAVAGTPREVAAGLDSRFGGLVTRLSFSTPYAADSALLSQVRARLRDSAGTAVASHGGT